MDNKEFEKILDKHRQVAYIMMWVGGIITISSLLCTLYLLWRAS